MVVRSIGVAVDQLADRGLIDRADLRKHVEADFRLAEASGAAMPGAAIDTHGWLIWADAGRLPRCSVHVREGPSWSRTGSRGTQPDRIVDARRKVRMHHDAVQHRGAGSACHPGSLHRHLVAVGVSGRPLPAVRASAASRPASASSRRHRLPHRVTRTWNDIRYGKPSESRTPPSGRAPRSGADAPAPPRWRPSYPGRRTSALLGAAVPTHPGSPAGADRRQGTARQARATRAAVARGGRGRPCSCRSAASASGRFAPTHRGARAVTPPRERACAEPRERSTTGSACSRPRAPSSSGFS